MPIVLYHTDLEKGRKIDALARRIGFQTRLLHPCDLKCTVSTLAGSVQRKSAGVVPQGEDQMPEILLFSGVEGDLLDRFLVAYRRAGIPPVALKAVVTPHNSTWLLETLIGELQREHAAMLLRMRQQM